MPVRNAADMHHQLDEHAKGTPVLMLVHRGEGSLFVAVDRLALSVRTRPDPGIPRRPGGDAESSIRPESFRRPPSRPDHVGVVARRFRASHGCRFRHPSPP